MDAKQFYAGLKKEDKERVEAVVAALKSSGLQVYASHLMGYLIPDSEISLSVTPNKGMARGDVQHSVDDVVRQFHGQEVRKAVPGSPRGRVLPDKFPSLTPDDFQKLQHIADDYFTKPKHPYESPNYKKENLTHILKTSIFEKYLPQTDLIKYNCEKRSSKNLDTKPDDSEMTTLCAEVKRLLGEFKKPNRDYKEKYIPVHQTPLSKFTELEPLDKMPPIDMKNNIFPKQPTVAREQRYRIGTIGETPIEVRVSYKPIDGLSKLIKVEL